jgi:hypothetical protein
MSCSSIEIGLQWPTISQTATQIFPCVVIHPASGCTLSHTSAYLLKVLVIARTRISRG